MNFAKPEPRTWSRCGAALPADAPGATGIELRSADFSPLRSVALDFPGRFMVSLRDQKVLQDAGAPEVDSRVYGPNARPKMA